MSTPWRLAPALTATAATAALALALAACGSPASSSPAATAATGTAPAATAAASGAAAGPGAATPGQASFPVTVTAGNGQVTIGSEPSRIVSLSPTATEDLYAVGAGPQVVAVDVSSDYPAGVPKTSLSGLTPNLEAIAKYKPSLVIASQDSGGLVAGMTKLGIPVLVEPAVATIDAAYAQIEQIGQATGHAATAAALTASMKQQVAAAVAKAGPAHQGLTYYWELSASPYYSVTSATFIGQVVALFGLKDIADAAAKPSDGGYPELTQEYIVTARPQLILLADNEPGDGNQTPAVVAKRPGWSAIPAVRNGAVIGLNDDIASRWGPRLPQLVEQIAAAIEKAPAS